MKRTAIVTVSALAAFAFAVAPAVSVSAWHPEGKITKFVKNETTNSTSVDANTEAAAVKAKKGDVLIYTITVKNTGKEASNGHNDLAFVEVTDTLPAGVELVSGELKQKFDGVIKPGQSETLEIRVKVTSDKEADLVKNRVCFTGDSTVKDNPQEGCDDAYASVKNEKPVETPKVPETPVTPVPPTNGQGGATPPVTKTESPEVLPETGLGAVLSTIAGTSAVAFGAAHYLRSKRVLKNSFLKR